MKNIIELYSVLDTARQREGISVLILVLMGAAAELMSLGAVIPFVGALTDIEQTRDKFSWIPLIYKLDNTQFILFILCAFSMLLMTSGAVRLLLISRLYRYSGAIGTDIAKSVFTAVINRDYLAHKSSHSGDILSSVQKVQSVTASLIIPVINGVSSAMIATCIVCALVMLEPGVALLGGGVFVGLYLLIATNAKKKLRKVSISLSVFLNRRTKVVQDSLGAIRDIKLDNLEEKSIGEFDRYNAEIRDAGVIYQVLNGMPRILIEVLGMSIIASISAIYVLLNGEAGLNAILPTLAAFAIGAQRLMPLLQQSYSGWAAYTTQHDSLEDVLQYLRDDTTDQNGSKIYLEYSNQDACVAFNNVSFEYQSGKTAHRTLKAVDLKIEFGDKVGVVGPSGSGKTTFLDLLLGLLKPTSGKITRGRANATETDETYSGVAYVPQDIFLFEGTIAQNVALDMDKIDFDAVEFALTQSCLKEFVATLPMGVDTQVGERGSLLSGGQRQRLGIARALYKKPNMLVMDEATSALDSQTEKRVMNALNNIKGLTLIMVAHRLETLAEVDYLIEMNDGTTTLINEVGEFISKGQNNRLQ